jgi:hypothetical protein
MPKKGVPTGPRITVEWGSVKRKVKGKSVSVKATSQVVKTTATLFGLKESKTGGTGASVKTITTKKGKKTILSGGVNKVTTRKIEASVDGKVWHQMPLPIGISLAKAFAILKSGKKAYMIKFHGGTPRIIGKPGKDTKTKSKAAAKTVK